MICDFWEVLNGSETLGAVALDFDGCILRANEAFARIVARESVDLIGHSIVELTEPSHRQSARSKIMALGEGARDRMCVTKQYVRPNGLPVWCQVEALVLCLPGTRDRQCIILFAWQLPEYREAQTHPDEIETHLKMLQELVRLTVTDRQQEHSGVNINMHGGSEYKQVADRGGRISSKHNDVTVLLIVACVCFAVVACVGMALYAGGYLRIKHAENSLEVQPAQVRDR